MQIAEDMTPNNPNAIYFHISIGGVKHHPYREEKNKPIDIQISGDIINIVFKSLKISKNTTAKTMVAPKTVLGWCAARSSME